MDFLGLKDGAVLDLDYFKSLIEQTDNKVSYIEQIAMKQSMNGGHLDPEDELKSALDEIKNNEKDLRLIVMISQTLFE